MNGDLAVLFIVALALSLRFLDSTLARLEDWLMDTEARWLAESDSDAE